MPTPNLSLYGQVGKLPGYIGAVRAYKPAVAPIVKRKVAAAPADPWAPLLSLARSSIQTPAQVQAQAHRWALADEAGVLKAQKAQTDAEVARINAQGSRAQGFARALSTLGSGADDQALSDYTTAAQTLQGLGTGLTGAVAEGYQSGADRAAEAVRNLTGGLGQVTAPAAEDIRNASQYAGVTLPASSLAESAPNAAALARAQALSRTAGIGQIAEGYNQQATQAIADAAADRRATIAKRPATIEELVQQLTTNRSQGIENLAGILGTRLSYQQAQAKMQADAIQQATENAAANRKQAWDEYIGQFTANTARSYLDQSQLKTEADLTGMIPGTNVPTWDAQQQGVANNAKRAGLAAQWSNYNGYRSDWQGNPLTNKAGQLIPTKGYKLNPAGTGVVKVPTPGKKGAAGGGGLTASGWSSLVKSAQSAIRKGAQSTPAGQLYKPEDKNADENGFIPDPNKPGKTATSYDDALASAIAAGPNTPRWKAKATALVQAEYSPGENGRPYGRKVGMQVARGSAKLAYGKGMTVDQARALMRAANLPPNYITQAIREVYYKPARSPINGIPPTSEDYPGYRPEE